MDSAAWQTLVTPYQRASTRKALWQLANTLVPFGLSWGLAVRLLDVSRALSLASCVLATGFLLRIYIIQHDCGHRSFFPDRRANDALGCLLGVVTLLPYFRWRHDHAIHHASGSHLDRRGTGDIWLMTLREYTAATPMQRARYRAFRNPLVLFGLGPLALFVVWQRMTGWTRTRREAASVRATNAAIAGALWLGGHCLGWRTFLAVQGPITWMGSTIAVWLFYIQHQFDDTYWAAPPDWDFATAAMRGASWYRLPAVLQWFTGNIGIHHIHHLSPKIPNYELPRCLEDNAAFRTVPTVTLLQGFRAATLKVWDEDGKRLMTWREVDQRVGSRKRRLPELDQL
jgi:omega-6 fatty acid desaturase (delta-12 desaturase)